MSKKGYNFNRKDVGKTTINQKAETIGTVVFWICASVALFFAGCFLFGIGDAIG